MDHAKELDKHYISTRCPNGFERGAPADLYTRADILRTHPDVEEIIVFRSFAKGTWASGSDADWPREI